MKSQQRKIEKIREIITDLGELILKKSELLSVVIPVYNVAPYLQRCLDSVCCQSYENLEIICVNDGSTDNSLSILQENADKDSRIHIISKENGGLVSARKTGLLQASGQFVTYVDSDDWIEQGMYKDLVALAVREDADIVTSGDIRDYVTHTIKESEYERVGVYREEGLLQLKSELIETDCFFRKNLSIHLYDKIFKTCYLKKYQLRIDNQISVGEDAAVVYPALLHANCCVVSGKNYYHYCLRDNSIMGIYRSNDLKSVNIMLNQLKEDFEEVSSQIPNALKQFQLFYAYVLLLRNAEAIIKYNNNFLYPFGRIEQGAKVIIYGAGKFGSELRLFFERIKIFEVVAILDKVPKDGVIHPKELKNIEYDVIVIAALIFDVIENIKEELHEYGVRTEEMLWVDARTIFT